MSVHLDNATVLKKVDSILEGDLGREKVMMSIDKGEYYGLSPVGSRIYDLCDGNRNVEQIAHQLEQEYIVEGAEWREDVASFMTRLIEFGLVELSET